MKHILMLCIVAFGTGIARAEDYRIFTASDGRVIEARILEYNAAQKKLRIERSNGKALWVEPRIFSEKDRQYILDWIQASEFLSTSKVRISIERHKKSQGKSGDDVHFSVTVKNRTDSDFRKLIFDYRFYIEGEGDKSHEDVDRCEAGQIQIDHLAAGEQKTIETKVHRMVEKYEVTTHTSYDQYGNLDTYTSEEKTWDDDDRGIWFRISGPELEGTALVREEWYPKELSKRVAWVEKPSQIKIASGNAQLPKDSKARVIALRKQAIKLRNAKGAERDIPRAIELYKQAYALEEDSYDAFEVGNQYLWQEPFRSFELAEEWLQIAIDKKFYRAHTCLAEYYYRGYDESARNGALAVQHAEAAADLEKGESRVYRTLASAYAYNGQYKEAVVAQENAVELFSVTEKTNRYYESLKSTLVKYQEQAKQP